ncbi:unnamed protein product [Pedinophyceae sp. YPF-701]|nr:unnamed protein product [Pedinophyceae sp. YPF-701]
MRSDVATEMTQRSGAEGRPWSGALADGGAGAGRHAPGAFYDEHFDADEGTALQARAPARNTKGLLVRVFSAVLILGAGVAAGLAIGRARWGPSGPSPGDDVARFFVVGDWGRRGQFNQTEVAQMMDHVAATFRPEFVLGTGDNFYEAGLTATEDPAFVESFVNVYSGPHIKQLPWHNVLGNHDYAGIGPDCSYVNDTCRPGCCYSAVHQLSPRLRDPALDPARRWHCARAFKLSVGAGARRVDIFGYDSNPFMEEEYSNKTWWDTGPGSLVDQSWEANLAELDSALELSDAAWKIVAGHHPVHTCPSAGAPHNDGPYVTERVAPVLRARGVQAYFNGHDHNLQAWRADGGVYYMTSGAGSETRPGWQDEAACRDSGAFFLYDASGFMAVRVREEEMVVEAYGIESTEPLHTFSIPRVREE